MNTNVNSIYRALKPLWKLRWDNKFKEVYWRLIIDASPTSLRLHAPEQTCVCGQVCPGRYHHFHGCPVAAEIAGVIAAHLPHRWCTRSPGAAPVGLHNIWFMRPPSGASKIHAGVWRVVCLAAICAMDVGRCAVSKKYIQQREQRAAAPQQPAVPPGQLLITDMLQPAPPTAAQLQHRQQLEQRQLQVAQERQRLEAQLLEDTKSLAKARFWELLVDFVQMRAAPADWLLQVSC